MRKLIREAVDWQKITDGRLDTDKYEYELGQGVMHKESGVLVIPMTLNFVLPYDELLKIKALVKSKLDFIEDVKFRFRYDNVILTEDEIIKNYLPYLIQILEGNGSGFAKVMDGKFFALDEESGTLIFRCFGKTSEEQLNAQISSQFERILLKNFGMRFKVRFENDEDVYQEKADDIKQDLMEEMVKTLEENRQKAQEAETASKDARTEERASGSENGFKSGRPWKAKKEAKDLKKSLASRHNVSYADKSGFFLLPADILPADAAGRTAVI